MEMTEMPLRQLITTYGVKNTASYGGSLENLTGMAGNISADPKFVSARFQ